MRRFYAILFPLLFAAAAFAAEKKAAPDPQLVTVQPPAQRQFHFKQRGPIDQKGFLQSQGNGCLKLRKYVFRREDGSDRMTYMGETDCTYASRVTTQSADEPNPQPTGPGLNKAVLRFRSADPPDKH